MYKKLIYIITLTVFIASCGGGSFDDVKRGITGAKKKSTDEFLVKKKDPLILPPDYENLPTPDDRNIAFEEISSFQKTLGDSIEDDSQTSGSAEQSILTKIRKK